MIAAWCVPFIPKIKVNLLKVVIFKICQKEKLRKREKTVSLDWEIEKDSLTTYWNIECCGRGKLCLGDDENQKITFW